MLKKQHSKEKLVNRLTQCLFCDICIEIVDSVCFMPHFYSKFYKNFKNRTKTKNYFQKIVKILETKNPHLLITKKQKPFKFAKK